MITIQDVTKRFGRNVAVNNLSVSIERGEAVALWGSNGAGKTTLVRCVLGILRFRGRIEVGGVNVQRRGKRSRAMIGYVPQELAFHDDMRVWSAMRFFATLRCAPERRAAELLDSVELSGHESKRVRDLSGGMKQRLALAIAMLSDPPVVILDEPTSNLDAGGRQTVIESLTRLKSSGKTILFASHRPDEVLALADRALVMEKGRLVRDARPEQLWPKADTLTLRLHVDSDQASRAAILLRDAGHDAHLNGCGLLVSALRDRKAAPVGVLERASIAVRDFEVLDELPHVRENHS